MKKILAIGDETVAKETYEGAEIDVVKLKPRNMQKDYDALVSYMMLSRVPWRKINETVKSWVAALKPGGEILVFVPSLEWAAYQILSPDCSPALLVHLFGTQDKPDNHNMSAFTMMDLRTSFTNAGVAITHAQTGSYMIGEHECECHVIRGEKKDNES